MTLDHLRQVLSRPPMERPDPSDPQGRRAAVAAILDDDLRLLFIKRAEHEADPWSGHIGFPGGRVEDFDESPLHGAIREVEEELHLRLHPEQLLGRLDDLSPLSGLPKVVVSPFVFHVPKIPSLRPNREVASVHQLALSTLLADVGRGPLEMAWKGQKITLPRVDFDGQRLWGMTLRMVDDLLDRLDGRGIGLQRATR